MTIAALEHRRGHKGVLSTLLSHRYVQAAIPLQEAILDQTVILGRGAILDVVATSDQATIAIAYPGARDLGQVLCGQVPVDQDL